MKGQSPGAAYNRVRLINRTLRYSFFTAETDLSVHILCVPLFSFDFRLEVSLSPETLFLLYIYIPFHLKSKGEKELILREQF